MWDLIRGSLAYKLTIKTAKNHSMNKHIYLASRSPRRAELLQQIGVDFEVLPSDVDEAPLSGEAPQDYVVRLARLKAEVGLARLKGSDMLMLPLLAADTTVCIDGVILGKPGDDADAAAMLRRMSGRWHAVLTGIAVATHSGIILTALSSTQVEMATLSEADIVAYIASGEQRDKAGAYAIQGLAGTFIRRIEGSYSGVMGLPIFETVQLLKNAGIKVL
jgi:septum formation protein